MHSQFEPEATHHNQIPARAALETYLDTLCRPLAEATPPEEQRAIRDEMRAHLLALAAAHEELGNTPEEAMQAALRKFGSAQKVGAALRNEHVSGLCSQEFVAVIGPPVTSLAGGFGAWTALYGIYQLYLA